MTLTINSKGPIKYSLEIVLKKTENFEKILKYIENEPFLLGVYDGMDSVYYANEKMDVCQNINIIKGKCAYPMNNFKGKNIFENSSIFKMTFQKYIDPSVIEEKTRIELFVKQNTWNKIFEKFPENELDFSIESGYGVASNAFPLFQINDRVLFLTPYLILILLGIQSIIKFEKELKIKQLYDKNVTNLILKNIFTDIKEILVFTLISLILLCIIIFSYLDYAYFILYLKEIVSPFIIIIIIYIIVIIFSYALIFYSQTTEIIKNKLNILRYLSLNIFIFMLIIISTFQIFQKANFNYIKRYNDLNIFFKMYYENHQIMDHHELIDEEYVVYGEGNHFDNGEVFYTLIVSVK